MRSTITYFINTIAAWVSRVYHVTGTWPILFAVVIIALLTAMMYSLTYRPANQDTYEGRKHAIYNVWRMREWSCLILAVMTMLLGFVWPYTWTTFDFLSRLYNVSPYVDMQYIPAQEEVPQANSWAKAGETIHYDFCVKNTESEPMHGVTLRDDSLSNVEFYRDKSTDPKTGPNVLAPGESVPGSCDYILTEEDIKAGYVGTHTEIMATDANGRRTETYSDTWKDLSDTIENTDTDNGSDSEMGYTPTYTVTHTFPQGREDTKELTITDTFDDSLRVKESDIKIFDSEGNDVTSSWTITTEENNVTVTAKDPASIEGTYNFNYKASENIADDEYSTVPSLSLVKEKTPDARGTFTPRIGSMMKGCKALMCLYLYLAIEAYVLSVNAKRKKLPVDGYLRLRTILFATMFVALQTGSRTSIILAALFATGSLLVNRTGGVYYVLSEPYMNDTESDCRMLGEDTRTSPCLAVLTPVPEAGYVVVHQEARRRKRRKKGRKAKR